MTITSANLGDTADIQITSVSFPNITINIDENNANENEIVSVLHQTVSNIVHI